MKIFIGILTFSTILMTAITSQLVFGAEKLAPCNIAVLNSCLSSGGFGLVSDQFPNSFQFVGEREYKTLSSQIGAGNADDQRFYTVGSNSSYCDEPNYPFPHPKKNILIDQNIKNVLYVSRIGPKYYVYLVGLSTLTGPQPLQVPDVLGKGRGSYLISETIIDLDKEGLLSGVRRLLSEVSSCDQATGAIIPRNTQSNTELATSDQLQTPNGDSIADKLAKCEKVKANSYRSCVKNVRKQLELQK
jgi:hypothetical protein